MYEGFGKLLQYRLGLLVFCVTVIALGVLGSALVHDVESTEDQRASEDLLEINRRIGGMLTVNHQLMLVAIERHFAAFESVLGEPFQLDKATRVDLGGYQVSQLKTGTQTVRRDFGAIEAFTKSSLGYVATVFVRHGDDFLRVATSLPDANGSPATGSLLGRDHPAYTRLIGANRYVGVAQVFGRPYMTKYKPLVSPSGTVIGLLAVGLDLSASFSPIKEEIKATRVGRSGYVFVIDTGPGDAYGRILLHPELEGQKVFDVAEASTHIFFRQMMAGGDATVARYQFRTSGGELREKIAAFSEFPAWNWVIGASTYYDEFTEQRLRLQYAIFGALLVAAAAIVLALKISIRRLILVPLLDMHESLRASESRFRSLITSSNDLIYTTDSTGLLTAVFEKGLIMQATAADAFIGQSVHALLGGADAKHALAHDQALNHGHIVYDWTVEGLAGRKDFQSSLSPMLDANGKVSGLVCIARDITERRRTEELAVHLAQHDVLTGLPNRMLMQDRLQQALLQAARTGRSVGLMYIDLDRFKPVNDEYGHEAGDQLLQAVAKRLLACVRQTDTVARIGGDEFVVILCDTCDGASQMQLAQEVLGAFEMAFTLPSCIVAMSPSIGICSYPTDARDAESMLRMADAAMYRAKSGGRAKFVFSASEGLPAQSYASAGVAAL